ncbi:MAG: GntR family transcriptional regulator [Erysipelotrichaceae bacterium]|nr:MAG: GntR family transcriptional regulator [Erysipelotrichaceae bacterium]
MFYLHINKTSKQPIYQQLVSCIKKAITDQVLKHDDQLPTDEDICTQFGISNIVVKQAYSVLTQEKLISRIRGKGTYVTTVPKTEMAISNIKNLEQRFAQMGVLKRLNLIEIITEHDMAFAYLGLESGTLVYRIILTAVYQTTPVYGQELILPCSSFPNLDKAFINPNYPLTLLAKDMYQLPLTSSKHDFSVENLQSFSSQMLQVERHEAAYIYRSTYLDQHKKPLFFIQSTYPGRYLKLVYTQEKR